MREKEQFLEEEEGQEAQILEAAEQKKSWREIGRERRKEKTAKTTGVFRAFGQKIWGVIKRIGQAGTTALDIGFAAPEISKAAGKEAAEFGVTVGREVGRGGKAVGEFGVGVGREVGRGAETAAGFVWQEMGEAQDWTVGKVEDTGEWLGEKYGEMRDFVGTNLEAIKQGGIKTKENFLSKVEAAKTGYTEWSTERKEAKMEKRKQEKIERLEKQIAKAVRRIEWGTRLKEEAERELEELRGINILGAEIEAEMSAA